MWIATVLSLLLAAATDRSPRRGDRFGLAGGAPPDDVLEALFAAQDAWMGRVGIFAVMEEASRGGWSIRVLGTPQALRAIPTTWQGLAVLRTASEGLEAQEERMGGLPAAVAVAEGLTLLEIMGSAGVTAWLAQQIHAALVLEPLPPWSEESQAWRSSLATLAKGATTQGMQIGEGCAWVLSPSTLMGRLAQLLRDELRQHGGRSSSEAIVEADRIIREAATRWAAMVRQLPKLADPAVVLTPEFTSGAILAEWSFALASILEIGQRDPSVQPLIESAARKMIGEMADCWTNVGPPGFWHNLGDLFKRSTAVPGKAIGEGTRAVAWSVLISLIVNEVKLWLEQQEGDARVLAGFLERFVAAFADVRTP